VRALTNPSRQVTDIVDAFITSLADSPATTAVIDDYHLLSDSSSAETLVRELRDQLDLRLFVGSRVRPEWATARAEIYGDILEIGPDELALSTDETTELLAESSGTVTSALLTKANGWPAVIGLAALARPSGRTPRDAPSSTLFRFFAEELFTAAPDSLQHHLPTMALLPSLSRELTEELFGDDAAGLLDDAVAHGFATVDEHQHELHPLIREYLLSKLGLHQEIDEQVEDAVTLSLRLEEWDHAFELITRFGRIDLLESLVEAAFKPLIRSGRIGTLEQIAAFARSRSADFSPLVTLIDAELAFRDGRFARAEALATRAADGLEPSHVSISRAHSLAGQAAQLLSDYAAAPAHFRCALASAHDDDDVRDALWGLVVTSISSEERDPKDAVIELQKRRDKSPTDLVRATTALMVYQRYTAGFANRVDIESSLRIPNTLVDPTIRISLTNTYAYQLILEADYRAAREIAQITRDEAAEFRLKWALLHAEWSLAASSLGLREFAMADRWLQHVERKAEVLNDGHLVLNSAALRARLLLALQRPDEAREALVVDDTRPVNPAMKAEVVATRALVFAVLGELRHARAEADRAAGMTHAVEVHALVACTHALCRSCRSGALKAFQMAERLRVWDPFVCSSRAAPAMVEHLVKIEQCQPRLRALFRQCQDFDLARRVGLEIGPRPRTGRAPLTARESEVLQLIRQGLTNRQIAGVLFISEATVKVHVRHILEKVGARTRTEAAIQLESYT
jgi:ATP/maltotriose-dependent transcriptional regulator MalT